MMIRIFLKAACFYLALMSFNANADYFPIPVEATANGTIDVIDPISGPIGAVPVNFYPAFGDFDFTYLGNIGVGYDSTFYNSPGTYTFDSTTDAVFPVSVPISMTVGADQLGMRTFIEWNLNIYDILMVWDIETIGALTTLTAIDVDSDGIRGYNMVTGPFAGFNVVMDVSIETPVPAAVWLFGSGLLAMTGLLRRKSQV